MSDIVSTLRGIARMTEDELLARDPWLGKLFAAREKASEAMQRLPLGSGSLSKARARWRTKCEAYERRRGELVVVHRAARAIDWPREKCSAGQLGHSEAAR